MLRNGVNQNLTFVSNTIDVDFLSTLNEFGNNNRVVLRDLRSVRQFGVQFSLVVDNGHSSTTQHVRRTNQNWVSDLIGKVLSFLDRSQFLPLRLVNSNRVQNLRELVTVFSLVNVFWVGTQDVASFVLQSQCNILRQLSTDTDDNTLRVLDFINVKDSLQGQFLEVQSVNFVEVSRHSFRVVVDHYGLLARLTTNTETNLLVRETQLFGSLHQVTVDLAQLTNAFQFLVHVNNVHQFVQEPFIDLGQLVNSVNSVVFMQQGLSDSQPSSVTWVSQSFVQVVEVVTLHTNERRIHLSDGFLERFFEVTTNGHDFTHRLHGRTDVSLDVLELGQIPSWDLGDHVVQRRLEVGGRGGGNRVWKLRQGVA